MTWFDTAAAKAKELAGIASKKTSEAVEISKLKMQASQVNSMIHSTYERIGTLVYDQEKTGVDNYDIIAVCISEVDSLLVDLNEINDKITYIKNGQVCPNCGAPNPSGAGYCASCGGSMSRKSTGGSGSQFASPMPSFTAEKPEEKPVDPAQLPEEVPAGTVSSDDIEEM